MKNGIDPQIIELYDEYTHRPLPRRVFLQRLGLLAGGAAAAAALLPLLENNYAAAQIVQPNDSRIDTARIEYPGKSGPIKAYLAKPKGEGRRGGVLVVHENRGLNPHIEDVARRVALAGFVAVAPDALSPHGGTPPNEDAAREAFTKIDRPLAVANLVAGVDFLAGRSDVNGKVGAVGFCWGGGMVNQIAVNSSRLVTGVSFYGPVPAAADVPKIKARMILHYAGLDQNINAGIDGYEAALKAADVRYSKYMYDGVNHAFHNDTGAARYNREAAELAWQRTIDAFKQSLS
jgi:carboxymethylenebutenolidase